MEKSIQALVGQIKKEMFPDNCTDLVLASAYDTAWLAMIPDLEDPRRPMFAQSLDWILSNQQEEFGFWGEPNHTNIPTVEGIAATVACIAALKTWDVGHDNIMKGVAFVHANAEKLLSEHTGDRTRWFAIVLPGMLESARSKGVNIFPAGMPEPVKSIFAERKMILETKTSPNQVYDSPLIYYLEALPPSYGVDCNMVLEYLNEDGSLFQSPSATAAAFMMTKDRKCKNYLESIVKMCGPGVPPVFPVEKDLIELCIVERLERLGLSDHFHQEIKDVLEGVYRNQIERVRAPIQTSRSSMLQIYKQSLKYRLLTMHGYRISPSMFTSFFEGGNNSAWNGDQSHEFFLCTILNVYRASDFIFSDKDEAGKVKRLARHLLEEGLRKAKPSTASSLRIEVEHELCIPWLARLDHLEHRDCIERGKACDLWPGKASYLRIPCLNNPTLLELARHNYAHRQSIYRSELEELERWVKDHGICGLEFGREKTTYCYFAVATTIYHTHMSKERMTAAKNGLLLTIIDDFFDCCGTLDELTIFTDAIERWDGARILDARGRVLFDALDAAINETATQALQIQGRDVTDHLRDIWREVVKSWLKEAEWGISGYRPSVGEYLKNASVSCAPQTSVLSAMYLVGPILTEELTHHTDYKELTDLLMLSCRLLNDVQTHEKESKEGTPNLVLLLMEGKANGRIEDVTAYISKILDRTKQKLVEHVLMDDKSCVPKPCRRLHLNVTTIFQMFYNSANVFDSATALVGSINKAFYDPLSVS